MPTATPEAERTPRPLLDLGERTGVDETGVEHYACGCTRDGSVTGFNLVCAEDHFGKYCHQGHKRRRKGCRYCG